MDIRLTTVNSTHFLTNPNDIFVGKSIEVYGEWSHGEIDLLAKILKRDSNVVEVGANIGAHTVFIARDICHSGVIYAFEPRRLLFQMLCANIALNALSNVYTFQKALGNKKELIIEGSIPMDRPSNFAGYSLGALKGDNEFIEIAPLDEMLDVLKRVSLLKADVEGFELDVLIGAQKLIARDRPILYLENDQIEKSAELIKFIMKMNYELWWHIVPLFRHNNLAHTHLNIFGDTSSYNMVCFPKEMNVKAAGFQKIDNYDFHPLRQLSSNVAGNTGAAV
jgi:FkbM family methyltransferase